jgi:hypothetical protein
MLPRTNVASSCSRAPVILARTMPTTTLSARAPRWTRSSWARFGAEYPHTSPSSCPAGAARRCRARDAIARCASRRAHRSVWGDLEINTATRDRTPRRARRSAHQRVRRAFRSSPASVRCCASRSRSFRARWGHPPRDAADDSTTPFLQPVLKIEGPPTEPVSYRGPYRGGLSSRRLKPRYVCSGAAPRAPSRAEGRRATCGPDRRTILAPAR